jgi:hypothetical protein
MRHGATPVTPKHKRRNKMGIYDSIEQMKYEYEQLLNGGDFQSHLLQVENCARNILTEIEKTFKGIDGVELSDQQK